MKVKALLSLFIPTLIVCSISYCSQIAAAQACSMAEPPLHTNRANLFSDEQEQWLGDAMAAQQEPDYDLLPDKDSAELDRIGRKLLAQLPPTPVHYTFRVYESNDTNGFSLAGGYVFISRKLITDARSEDEVAGVLAHEIGHIYTKQLATAFTRELKYMLGVSSIASRQDLDDKLQLLLNAPWKSRAGQSEDEAEKDELLADRVGIFALIKAGYAPRAMSENLDRITANKGRTGNFFTDIVGATSEISLRVRTTRKIVASLPSECGQRAPASSASFKAFQQAVENAPIHPLVEPTAGLKSFKLDPPMRAPLSQVRFSPDGKYILAQDFSTIYVLSRQPFRLLYGIDARGAYYARFSPDSRHVVFHFPSMRVEKWNLETGQRESYHEMVDYEGCEQTSLSPDGSLFVCLSRSEGGAWLKVRDVESGKLLINNKNFWQGAWIGSGDTFVRNGGGLRIATVLYSQDGKTALFISGSKVLALDLTTRQPIHLGGDLAHLQEGNLAFVDSGKLVYGCGSETRQGTSKDTFKMCMSTFPDGLPVSDFRMGYQWIEPVAKGTALLAGPFKTAAAMLLDPATGKATAGFKMNSVDVFDQTVASESESGGIVLSQIGAPQLGTVDLPPAPLYDVEAAEFSPDGRYLAYSSKLRSSIWDLDAQKRILLMRPFRAVRIDPQDQMFAQFQAANQQPGANYRIDLKSGKSTPGPAYRIDQFQRRDVEVTFEPQEKSGDTTEDANLVVADPVSGTKLWSRLFRHEVPLVRQFEDGTVVFISQFSSDPDQESKNVGTRLVKSSDWRKEWVSVNMAVVTLNSQNGQIRNAVAIEQHRNSGNDSYWAAVYGNYLVVHGTANNSVIYRLADGVRLGAFYGRVIAGDGELGLLAATNRDQEVILIDAANGHELKRVTVDHLPRAARFIPDKKVLEILTASQRVYSLDLPERPAAPVAASK